MFARSRGPPREGTILASKSLLSIRAASCSHERWRLMLNNFGFCLFTVWQHVASGFYFPPSLESKLGTSFPLLLLLTFPLLDFFPSWFFSAPFLFFLSTFLPYALSLFFPAFPSSLLIPSEK